MRTRQRLGWCDACMRRSLVGRDVTAARGGVWHCVHCGAQAVPLEALHGRNLSRALVLLLSGLMSLALIAWIVLS
jgi:hypothetical protein